GQVGAATPPAYASVPVSLASPEGCSAGARSSQPTAASVAFPMPREYRRAADPFHDFSERGAPRWNPGAWAIDRGLLRWLPELRGTHHVPSTATPRRLHHRRETDPVRDLRRQTQVR